ncbi:MAG: DUF2284 domain-containing protein [Candidatus Krumholzibacteriia bacterium]
MKTYKKLEAMFAGQGFEDFKLIEPGRIVSAQWVHMKCTFGCPSYGKNACCHPNVPSVPERRQLFDEYRAAAIFQATRA